MPLNVQSTRPFEKAILGEEPAIPVACRAKISNDENGGFSNTERYCDCFTDSLKTITYLISKALC